MSKTVAILQSNYIPWKGYFDIINMVDEFILFDEVQYTTDDWRNRNRIPTPNGIIWLTIPIRRNFGQQIDEAQVSDHRWTTKHWRTLQQNYAKAAYFGDYATSFEQLYKSMAYETHLSKINHAFLSLICTILEINTPMSKSSDYPGDGSTKTQRLINLCQQSRAGHYLSGPAARNYLDEALFRQAGITVNYMDYTGYMEYNQLVSPFEHKVSIVDLIFNKGPDAIRYMKSFA